MKSTRLLVMMLALLTVCRSTAAEPLFPDLTIPPESEAAFTTVALGSDVTIVLVSETSRLLEAALRGGDVSKDVDVLWKRHQGEIEKLVAAFQKAPEVACPNRQKLTYNTPGDYLPLWRTAANLLLLQALGNAHLAQQRLLDALLIGKKSLHYPVSVVAYFASIKILSDAARTLVLLKRRGDIDAQKMMALAAEFPSHETYVAGFAFALDGDYLMVANLLESDDFEKEVAHWSNHRITDVEKLNRDLMRKMIANRYQDLRRDFALGLPVQNMTIPSDLSKNEREFLAFARIPADIYNRLLRIVMTTDLLLHGKVGINFR